MKLNAIASAIILSSSILSGAALASDGTVHFRGEIIDSACEITTVTKEQNVDLGKVSKTAFNGVGSTSAPTQFTISLEK
ncbi:fimbrial protein [Enterobacter hormaechei]